MNGPYLSSEFRDPIPKNVAWGDDRINLKISIVLEGVDFASKSSS